MDRQLVERHLQLALNHVAQGEHNIARQKAIILELERDGHDTVRAHEILATFEAIQKMHVADRDRLQRELGHARV
jgi:hypothetical protein